MDDEGITILKAFPSKFADLPAIEIIEDDDRPGELLTVIDLDAYVVLRTPEAIRDVEERLRSARLWIDMRHNENLWRGHRPSETEPF